MVKKVTLDTLDIEEEILVHEEITETAAVEVKKPAKWHATRWFLIVSGALVVLGGAGGLSLLIRGTNKAVPPVPAPQTVSQKVNMAVLNDLFITGTDEKGNERVLLCDLTLELQDEEKQDVIKERLLEVRNCIFQAAKKKKLEKLFQLEGRTMLKEAIGMELSRLLGQEAIKGIYFTRFVIL